MKRHSLWLAALALACGVNFAVFAATPDAAELRGYQFDPGLADIYRAHWGDKRVPLGGWWRLQRWNSEAVADGDARLQPGFDDSAWEEDLLPNNLNTPFLKPQASEAERTGGGYTVFRRNFVMPAVGDDRAVLVLEGVNGNAAIFVNGKFCGKIENFQGETRYLGPKPAGFIDITDAVKPGDNLLAVSFYHSGKPVEWGFGAPNGLMGRIHVDIVPETYAKNILVTPREDLKNVDFKIIPGGRGGVDGWRGEIFEWSNDRVVSRFELSGDSGSAAIPDPKLWSPEKPFLYGVKFFDRQGKLAGVQRFGMRTFVRKGGDFLLNGRPVMLRGICLGDDNHYVNFHGYTHAEAANAGDYLRRVYGYYRDLGINHFRLHSHRVQPAGYDLFDELGILIADEIAYPSVRIEAPTRADDIDIKGYDLACDAEGNLKEDFVRELTGRLYENYSHPSVALFSYGNEIRDPVGGRVSAMLNHIYELYGSIDRQNRPRTPSSGRYWKDGKDMAEMRATEKCDYVDTHDYTGSINNLGLPFCEPVSTAFHRKMLGLGEEFPLVNGETVYMASHYYADRVDPVWNSPDSPTPDWDKLMYVYNWTNHDKTRSFLALYWVRNWGSKGYKYDRDGGRAFYLDGIIANQRKLWPDWDGYEILSDSYFEVPRSCWPFDRKLNSEKKTSEAIRNVCSPLFATLDYVAPNRYAGSELKTQLTVINNGENAADGLKVAVIPTLNGAEFPGATIEVGRLEPGEKKLFPCRLTLPDEPGYYQLETRILTADGAAPAMVRRSALNLNSKEALFAPVATGNKRIALFDPSEKIFGALRDYSSAKVLKKLKVPFDMVDENGKFSDYDLVIVGAGAADAPAMANAAAALREYAVNGGRILALEQSMGGRVPFLEELSYTLAGASHFTEILNSDHPLFKDMAQSELFCWNQDDWSVYHNFITPISPAALTAGGDSTQWGADYFGMVNAQVKLGAGDVMFIQSEAVKCFNKDAAAVKLLRNALETMCDDDTRALAREFIANRVASVRPMRGDRALPLDLKPLANRGYADPVAGDGQGGWSDQGPRNDLGGFQPGNLRLGGVPFTAIDPAGNNGNSMVVVSSNQDLTFKPLDAAVIPVGAKADRVVFLYLGAWISPGKSSGKFTIRRASGAEDVLALIPGVTIADWWSAPTSQVEKAECVWSMSNGSGVVGAFAAEWVNPDPADEVETITLTSDNNSVIGLLAATAEKANN